MATQLRYDLRCHNPINHISWGDFSTILQYAHSVKLILAIISPTRPHTKSDVEAKLAEDYLARASRSFPCQTDHHGSEAALLTWLDRQAARTAPVLILLDSRGKQLTSEEIAALIGRHRDRGTQTLVLAIGPPDGWSETARKRAALVLSFGAITLPHKLVRVVLAEQIYRATTILAGHPYHSGH
jgi:23S rRNA (pseudouridine1915-N3)-methyltransferase